MIAPYPKQVNFYYFFMVSQPENIRTNFSYQQALFEGHVKKSLTLLHDYFTLHHVLLLYMRLQNDRDN